MKIHKEGMVTLLLALFFLAILNVIFIYILSFPAWFRIGFAVLSFVFYLFLLHFFRLPTRKTDYNDSLLYAPADGELVVVEETFEPEYFKDKRLQVSIFMSPMNVHVNKYPLSGEVTYYRYHPGKFLVAWHPKSSELNERSSVVIKTEAAGEILIRQVAGAVARRIVTYSKVGKKVRQGEELGFIKFGSRVDMYLPLGTKIEIPIGTQVRWNKSVLARF